MYKIYYDKCMLCSCVGSPHPNSMNNNIVFFTHFIFRHMMVRQCKLIQKALVQS